MSSAATPPASPEALFGALPHSSGRLPGLWSHQADLLREYAKPENVNALDIALELPTGSGKTLVGLLIADWRRRHHGHRVVYACPTKQLARQVAEAAGKENIPVVLLTGPRRGFDVAAFARYASGQAVAVTVYSHVFNTNPAFSDAQALVFDDAHAAEGYVAAAWALEIRQSESGYAALLDEVRDALDPHLVAWMTDPAEKAFAADARMLPLPVVQASIDRIDRALAAHCRGREARFKFEMIRPALGACLFYLSPAAWYIRPMIPPTFEHAAFTEPAQRVYLSATLGDAGELERAFGRTGIVRVPVPPAWEANGAGRRFFVFPALAAGASADKAQLLKRIAALADRVLVLTPDDARAVAIADQLEVPEDERFNVKDPDSGIAPFLAAPRGTLLAAGRYDGMDLRDEACRMSILAGVPGAMHAQDRFLASRLRATNVLVERVRTRVVQGAGRCTRGPRDSSVVVVEGDDLLHFLCRTDVRAALPIDLQAELTFGLEASTAACDDLLDLVESAYLQDEAWRDQAEPELTELRRGARRTLPPGSEALAASAPREVEAWRAAWGQDWEAAALAGIGVLDRLRDPALGPYRSLWAYLASSWSTLALARGGGDAAAARAAELMRTADEAAAGSPWLRELSPSAGPQTAGDPLDDGAPAAVLALLTTQLHAATVFETRCAKMIEALAQSEAERYEQGLTWLGGLLGAEAWKPEGDGRADSVWMWPKVWVTLEAKSEQKPEGMISQAIVRQANTQLDSLAADRSAAPPPGSFAVVVSPRRAIYPDAVPIANANLYLVTPAVISSLAGDAARACTQVRRAVRGVEGDERVERARTLLWEHRLLPTQVRDRLTSNPVGGG